MFALPQISQNAARHLNSLQENPSRPSLNIQNDDPSLEQDAFLLAGLRSEEAQSGLRFNGRPVELGEWNFGGGNAAQDLIQSSDDRDLSSPEVPVLPANPLPSFSTLVSNLGLTNFPVSFPPRPYPRIPPLSSDGRFFQNAFSQADLSGPLDSFSRPFDVISQNRDMQIPLSRPLQGRSAEIDPGYFSTERRSFSSKRRYVEDSLPIEQSGDRERQQADSQNAIGRKRPRIKSSDTKKGGRYHSEDQKLALLCEYKTKAREAKAEGKELSARGFSKDRGLGVSAINSWSGKEKVGVLVPPSFTDQVKLEIVKEFQSAEEAAKQQGQKLSAKKFGKARGLGARAIEIWVKRAELGGFEVQRPGEDTSEEKKIAYEGYFQKCVELYCSRDMGLSVRRFAEAFNLPTRDFTAAVKEKKGISPNSTNRLSEEKVNAIRKAFEEDSKISSEEVSERVGVSPGAAVYWLKKLRREKRQTG